MIRDIPQYQKSEHRHCDMFNKAQGAVPAPATTSPVDECREMPVVKFLFVWRHGYVGRPVLPTGRLVGASARRDGTRSSAGVLTTELGKCHRVASSSVVINTGT